MATKEQILDEMTKKEELYNARINALSLSLRLLELDVAYLKHEVKLQNITDNGQIKTIDDMLNIIDSIRNTFNLSTLPYPTRVYPLKEGE